MTRAAIYVRISLDQSGDQLSIARQEEECRALCEARGWEVAGVYADNSISATEGRLRPSYEALPADAGESDCIVVWQIDRLV